MELTGITRARTYSPNQHAENDRLILEATADVLERRGVSTRIIAEEDVGQRAISTLGVFSMCQGTPANTILAGLERDGLLVINSPRAILNCYRQNLYRRFGSSHDLLPPTFIVSTSDSEDLRDLDDHPGLFASAGAFWIKRGDVHSTQEGDVIKVATLDQCRQVLAAFRRRQIRFAAIQQHMPGDVIKFYGVVGTGFFRYYHERDHNICPDTFSSAHRSIEGLAQCLSLDVYGGDAVVGPDGQISIIDVNDWPSYACFREEAAEAIADRIVDRAVQHDSTRTTPDRPRLVDLSGVS